MKDNVPELEELRLKSHFGDEFDSKVLSLSEAMMLVIRFFFDDHDHPTDVEGVWSRLLPVIEVALELCELLFEEGREEDGLAVDVFAGSGVMCEVTRKIASLETLLPWMGPVSLDTARIEITNHRVSRGYDVNDVDWSRSGVAYGPLGISPLTLMPPGRT